MEGGAGGIDHISQAIDARPFEVSGGGSLGTGQSIWVGALRGRARPLVQGDLLLDAINCTRFLQPGLRGSDVLCIERTRNGRRGRGSRIVLRDDGMADGGWEVEGGYSQGLKWRRCRGDRRGIGRGSVMRREFVRDGCFCQIGLGWSWRHA